MDNIINNIICAEFEKNIGKDQLKKDKQFAMKITFRISPEYDLEEGYRHLQVLIYSPLNYVGVFVKEDWVVIPNDEVNDDGEGLKPGCEYRKGETPWKMISYHDSCWRTDGVESILHQHRKRISGLDYRIHWYEAIELTTEFKKELLVMMDRDGDYRYEFMKGVLQFEKDVKTGAIIDKE